MIKRAMRLHRQSSLDDDLHIRAAQLDAAQVITDLRNPPGNKLEALKGDRKGQYSIRIDRQWRICFVWNDSKVSDIEIVDYH